MARTSLERSLRSWPAVNARLGEGGRLEGVWIAAPRLRAVDNIVVQGSS